MDYRYICVKSLSVLSFLLNFFPLFLRKKLYVIVWIPLKTQANVSKTKTLTNILHSLNGQLLMVQVLILALKAGNVEACFILSGISFHNLGPKLDTVSVQNVQYACFY